jgi:hypothetical protein
MSYKSYTFYICALFHLNPCTTWHPIFGTYSKILGTIPELDCWEVKVCMYIALKKESSTTSLLLQTEPRWTLYMGCIWELTTVSLMLWFIQWHNINRWYEKEICVKVPLQLFLHCQWLVLTLFLCEDWNCQNGEPQSSFIEFPCHERVRLDCWIQFNLLLLYFSFYSYSSYSYSPSDLYFLLLSTYTHRHSPHSFSMMEKLCKLCFSSSQLRVVHVVKLVTRNALQDALENRSVN